MKFLKKNYIEMSSFCIKTIVFLLLILNLSCFCIAFEYETTSSEVKVGLYHGTTALSSATVSGSDGYYISTDGNKTKEFLNVSSLKLKVSAKGKTQLLTMFGAVAAEVKQGTKILISPAQSGAALTISGTSYRGYLEVYSDSNNKLVVINVIDVDSYLKGVLPSEVYPSWHEEALKAAAVVSRTFAVKNAMSSSHSTLGFDVCSSTHCQVYSGTSKETKSTNKAISDTTGKLIYYNGSIATTPYHSSSGGGTESSAGAWGGNKDAYPYLSSFVTPYEDYRNVPNGKWLKIIPKGTVDQYVSSLYSSKLAGPIESFDYERSNTGYIQKMTVKDKSGLTVQLNTSGSVRSFFGSLVKSANFGIADTYIPSMKTTSGISVITSQGESVLSGINGYSYITSDGISTTPGLEEVTVFDGQGYGHGVGMSQYGAMCMANLGFKYDEIINHYFPGTEIITVSE